MSQDQSAQDPLEFVRGMWSSMGFSLPGMVTPTLDVDELDKRIADLKAVEGWLKMNLNMLQMTTQGLEVQRAALAAVKAMSEHARAASERPDEGASSPPEQAGNGNPFAAAAAMWPWPFMTQPAAEAAAPTNERTKRARAPQSRATSSRKTTADKK